MKAKVGVFILSYLRTDTTPKVVKSALNQTVKPDKIYVFNNNPNVQLDYPYCVNINSQENFRCIIRHAIALTRELDYCLFVDDDVIMGPKTIENFLKYSKKHPESILGYYGRNIMRDSNLYSVSGSNWFTNTEKEVDMIMGMIHFCKSSKLANSFILKKNIPDLPLTEDDILLSLGNKYIDKQKNYVIPYDEESKPIPVTSTKTGGLSHSGGHEGRRRDAVRRILRWAGELPEGAEEKPTETPKNFTKL